MAEIEYIAPKFVTYFPVTGKKPDMHMVKEEIFHTDGTSKTNLRFIKDYKRPFWTTKHIYRNHKEKKEFEDISKCEKHMSVQSTLANNIASKLGMQGYKKNKLWDVKDSPFLYGADIASSTFIMNEYAKKWNGKSISNSYCALDIEADIDTKIVSVITIIFKNKIRTYVNKSLVQNIDNTAERVLNKLRKAAPGALDEINKKNKKKISIDYFDIEVNVYNNNIDVIKATFEQIHKWQPDIVSAWGARYDISTMSKNLEDAGINPADVFSDPTVPKELRVFKFKEGQVVHVTESGVRKNKDYHEQWHTWSLTASFKFIDAMATYNFIRVGTANVFGGYGIDNIAKVNGVGGKLNLSKTRLPSGSISWHKYMVRVEPINYIVYNIWDVMIMMLLDNKTLDIQLNLGLLSGLSSFDIFNSGPKRIVDDFFFYALNENMVMGTAPKKQTGSTVLTLKHWINKNSYIR